MISFTPGSSPVVSRSITQNAASRHGVAGAGSGVRL
jgi:hypothetical protein